MFFRAVKSVVKNLGQQKYYVNEEKIKVRVIGAAGEIGQTLTNYTKTGSKLQTPSLPNSRSKSHVLMQTLEKSRSLKTSQAQKVRDPRTESSPQKFQRKNNAIPSYFANRELDLERTVAGLKDKEMKLSSENTLKKQPETSGQHSITDFPVSEAKVIGQMWVLTRLPAVQHNSLPSQWRQLEQTRSEGLTYMPRTVQSGNVNLSISRIPKVTSEAMIPDILWLGDPDCGEGPPSRPTRGPCHPPDGPCVPMKKPGYPAKPKSPKKDFCFNCPPKKPCNLNKCPPDSCDGTCGNADIGQRNLLKLHSESQANRSNMRSIVGTQAVRIIATSTRNGNRQHHHQATDLGGMRRQFCSSCNSKSPKKPSKKSEHVERNCDKLKPSESPSPPTPPKCQAPETATEPKVLYRKCPPLPKLPKLPECPKLPEAKPQEPCPKIIPPKCPPLPKLPKCPECPKPAEARAEEPCTKTSGEKSCTKASVPKCHSPMSNKPEKNIEKTDLNSSCQADESDYSSTKKHDSQLRDYRIDYPKDSSCCATVPRKEEEKKKKSPCDKISGGTKRKMSTYHHSYILNYFKASSLKIPYRRFSISGILSSSFSSKTDPPSSDSHPQWKSRKCKTVKEVCDDGDPKMKALKCKPTVCPNNPITPCYPEKPHCGEVRKTAEKKIDQDAIRKTKLEDCRQSTIVKPVEKIDYTKIECESPRYIKLGPCPVPPPSLEKTRDKERCRGSEGTPGKASSQPLPKPPSAPVHLCKCPPPPKMHPGSCPCYEEIEVLPNVLIEPCAKPKYPCPEGRVYYCPPIKGCEKKEEVCNDNKKPIKP